MSTVLWLADGAITVGDLWLTSICIRRQVVLDRVTAIAGFVLAFATSRSVSGYSAPAALGLGLVLLVLGAALLRLGEVLERLLDDPLD